MVQGTLSLEEMHLIVEREHSRRLENQALGGFWKQPGDQESGARRLCLAHAGSHAGLTSSTHRANPKARCRGIPVKQQRPGMPCTEPEWRRAPHPQDLGVRALGRHLGICT